MKNPHADASGLRLDAVQKQMDHHVEMVVTSIRRSRFGEWIDVILSFHDHSLILHLIPTFLSVHCQILPFAIIGHLYHKASFIFGNVAFSGLSELINYVKLHLSTYNYSSHSFSGRSNKEIRVE